VGVKNPHLSSFKEGVGYRIFLARQGGFRPSPGCNKYKTQAISTPLYKNKLSLIPFRAWDRSPDCILPDRDISEALFENSRAHNPGSYPDGALPDGKYIPLPCLTRVGSR